MALLAMPSTGKAGMSALTRNNVQVKQGQGPVLMYAHGFGCNQRMWDRIWPAFTSTHQQVLFDHLGCGQSDGSAFSATHHTSLHGYAKDVVEICEALPLGQPVTFVGHSIGASIGMLAAIQRPELFDRLVLIGASPCFLNDPPAYAGGFERSDLEKLLNLMGKNFSGWSQFLDPLDGHALGTELNQRESPASFGATDPVVQCMFARTAFYADLRADVPKVHQPCLILQPRRDPMVPVAAGAYLHLHLKRSRLKLLDIAGHSGPMSHPELLIEAMRAYLCATV